VTISVVIADDHPPTRAEIREALSKGGIDVCAEVASAQAAVTTSREHRPDVALLDVRMPGNGITAARTITSVLPDTAVVMLTVSSDDSDLFEALRAGASGYLLKDTDPERLPFALRGVLEGEAALPRTMTARLICEFRGRERPNRWPKRAPNQVRLTNREWDVLEMMDQGLTTAEMAERMFVGTVTVRTHVHAILHKLQLPDRASVLRVMREVQRPQHGVR
jgi:DNA-binding NarL/FixJ family response regulator